MKSTNKIYGVDASGNQIDVLEALANSTFSATGTYPDLTAGNATTAATAITATTATTATTASKLSANAGTATNPVYFSGGVPVQCGSSLAVSVTGTAAGLTGDVVTGQTVSSLSPGKTYINCTITASSIGASLGCFINCLIRASTITGATGNSQHFYGCSFMSAVTVAGSGAYYLENSSGTFTVTSSTAGLYISNCSNAVVSTNYPGTVFENGISLLYDKDSSSSSINRGYTSGIKVGTGAVTISGLSNYRFLIVGGVLSDKCTGIIVSGQNGTIVSQSGTGKYFGKMSVSTSATTVSVTAAREWTTTVGDPASIGDFDTSSTYYLSQIWGVL